MLHSILQKSQRFNLSLKKHSVFFAHFDVKFQQLENTPLYLSSKGRIVLLRGMIWPIF